MLAVLSRRQVFAQNYRPECYPNPAPDEQLNKFSGKSSFYGDMI